MKITIVVSSGYGGGAERVACDLSSWLAEQKHQVTLLMITDRGQIYPLSAKVRTISLKKPLKEIRGPAGKAAEITKAIFDLRQFLRKEQPDLYVVFLYDTLRLLMMFRRQITCPVIYAECNSPAHYAPRVQKNLKKMLKKMQGIVFQTEEEKAFYSFGSSIACAVLPNAVPADALKSSYEEEREKTIVAAGRLHPQKRHDMLIRAFAEVHQKYPEYTLVIYGDGPEKEKLTELVRTLGLENHVLLRPFDSRLWDKIKTASMFVLSSDYEGISNALLGAMALGLPCIATDCPAGGSRMLLQNHDNGILVLPGDSQALAEAMIYMIEHPAEAGRMGKAAREVQNMYSVQRVYAQWEEFLLKVLAQGKQIQ